MAACALCGALVACAGAKAQPASTSTNSTGAARTKQQENSAFAPRTESPQPAIAPLDDADERTLSDACGDADVALTAVATQLVEQQTVVGAELDVDAISYALRAAGAPYVWPRAWLFSGSEGQIETAKARMQRWLASFSDGGTRRCGVRLRHEGGSRISVAALAVDVLADL